jgi:hypothetical protein
MNAAIGVRATRHGHHGDDSVYRYGGFGLLHMYLTGTSLDLLYLLYISLAPELYCALYVGVWARLVCDLIDRRVTAAHRACKAASRARAA